MAVSSSALSCRDGSDGKVMGKATCDSLQAAITAAQTVPPESPSPTPKQPPTW